MKTVIDVLVGHLQDNIDNASVFLEDGGPKDFNEYREVVGLVRGLKAAINIIEEVMEQQGRDEDDWVN